RIIILLTITFTGISYLSETVLPNKFPELVWESYTPRKLKGVEVFKDPSTSSTAIASIPFDDKVTGVSFNDEFIFIDEYDGYVEKEFLFLHTKTIGDYFFEGYVVLHVIGILFMLFDAVRYKSASIWRVLTFHAVTPSAALYVFKKLIQILLGLLKTAVFKPRQKVIRQVV
ncbi:MAG: hypothetical protein RJQ14_26525, partial [Marinoscillum sp.]